MEYQFGRRLRELREREGLSAYALAREAGVSKQMVSALESGDRLPGWAVACKLADALRVSLEEFRKKPRDST